MEQKAGALSSAHQQQPDLVQPIPSRPAVPDRGESSLPPHLRPSVTRVPVTPGITRETYESESSDKSSGAAATEAPGRPEGSDYFSRRSVDHALAASPLPGVTNQEGQSFQNKVDIGAQEGTNFLRRLSAAAIGAAPAETMSDIRAMSPELALSGNIISATFNIPHSLKYRKGADWVRNIPALAARPPRAWSAPPNRPALHAANCVEPVFACQGLLRDAMVGLMSWCRCRN